MIKARFYVPTPGGDFRPMKWPIKHPYWCTGWNSDGHPILIAYAESLEEIKELWPEAEDIDVMEDDASEYAFTSRFPMPDWMKETPEVTQ